MRGLIENTILSFSFTQKIRNQFDFQLALFN